MANVLEIAKRARAAALELSGVSEERKNAALARIAELLEQEAENIIAANSRDLEKAAAAGLSKPMLERLSLDRKKIAGIAEGVRHRDELRKRIRGKPDDDPDVLVILEKITEINRTLKSRRSEVKLCEQIKERQQTIEKQIRLAREYRTFEGRRSEDGRTGNHSPEYRRDKVSPERE